MPMVIGALIFYPIWSVILLIQLVFIGYMWWRQSKREAQSP